MSHVNMPSHVHMHAPQGLYRLPHAPLILVVARWPTSPRALLAAHVANLGSLAATLPLAWDHQYWSALVEAACAFAF